MTKEIGISSKFYTVLFVLEVSHRPKIRPI